MANRLPYYSMAGHVSVAAKFTHKVPVFLVLSCTHSVGPLLAFAFTRNPRTKFIARLRKVHHNTNKADWSWYPGDAIVHLTCFTKCFKKVRKLFAVIQPLGWAVPIQPAGPSRIKRSLKYYCVFSNYTARSDRSGADPIKSTMSNSFQGSCLGRVVRSGYASTK